MRCMTEKSRKLMKKIHYRRTVYSCGFVKSIVTSILGFGTLLIFNNLMLTMGNPLTPSTQLIFGILIMMGCVSAILLFDSQREKTKEAELDLIFEEILKAQGIKTNKGEIEDE